MSGEGGVISQDLAASVELLRVREKGFEEALGRFMNAARKSIDLWIERYFRARYPSPLADRLLYAVMGGKRLRGSLLILYAHIEGDVESPLDLAAAVEMAHSASLVHDDIADCSKMRRGREAFWVRFGLHEAVTIPHMLIAEALSIIGRKGKDLLIKSIEGWRLAARGQYCDILAKRGESKLNYRELIRLKSGAVFATACYIGSSIAGGDANAAHNFGMHLGTAYQALDDAVSIVRGDLDSGSAILALNVWGKGAVEELLNLAKREIEHGLLPLSSCTREVLAIFALKTLERISIEGGKDLAERMRETISRALHP